MRYHPALFLMTLAMTTSLAGGQEPRRTASAEDLRDVELRASDFLREFRGTSGPERALRDFVEGSQLADRDGEVDKLIDQAVKMESLYGKLLGQELVSTRSVGEDLVMLRYLLKAEEFPIVWHFSFYRAPASGTTMLSSRPWKLIEIRFDTNLEALDQ